MIKYLKDLTVEEIQTLTQDPNYVPLFEKGELVAFEWCGDDTSPEAQTANKKLARELQEEMTQKEPWYEHESPEEYREDNGNLPPGYSDRDL